jgi:ribosomal protein S18 acetylase RimI-like enzyme
MSTDMVTFRQCAPPDLAAMQAVRRLAFEPVFNSFRALVGDPIAAHAFAHADAEQAKLLTDICEAGSGHQVVVAMVGGSLVGFASYKVDSEARLGEIGLNAVHPGYAGQGIGTRMYEHVLARMKESGMLSVTVSAGGDPSHAAARRAYAKAGFSERLSSIHLYRLL